MEHATLVELRDGIRLRLVGVADLLALKLQAAEEPKRRASKREHDVADVLALLEEHPDAKTVEFLEQLHQVRTRLLAIGPDFTAD